MTTYANGSARLASSSSRVTVLLRSCGTITSEPPLVKQYQVGAGSKGQARQLQISHKVPMFQNGFSEGIERRPVYLAQFTVPRIPNYPPLHGLSETETRKQCTLEQTCHK